MSGAGFPSETYHNIELNNSTIINNYEITSGSSPHTIISI